MSAKYSVDATKIKYKKTRRGVNATATIMKNGVAMCILYDVAEEIVATVDFKKAEDQVEFLADANKIRISEYARKLVMDAEQAWAHANKDYMSNVVKTN
jgi:hypothetical protein